MESIKNKIKGKKVVIWGCGFLGNAIENLLKKNNIVVDCYWDRNAENLHVISQIPVRLPYSDLDLENTFYIIAVGNYNVRKNIQSDMEKHKIKNILSETDLKNVIGYAIRDLEEEIKKSIVPDTGVYSLKERLEKAVDFAVRTNNIQWYEQNVLLEKIRISKVICYFSNFEFSRIVFELFMKFFENNGIKVDGYTGVRINEDFTKGRISYIPIDKIENDENTLFIIMNPDSKNDMKYLFKHMNSSRGGGCIPFSSLCVNVFDSYHIGSEWFEQEKLNILNCLDLFADRKSKEIYVDVFCSRVARHLAKRSFVELNEPGEYFNKEIFDFSNEETFVDCGAYLGESIEEFLKIVKGNFNKIHSFELDKENFNILKLRMNALNDSRIKVYNMGISNEEKEFCYYSNGAGGSALSEWADNKAIVKPLDKVLKNEKITFIKMDIEGSEKQAIEGAETLIKNYHPKLAISAYHHLEDLWKIPILIKSLNPQYQLYLRHHSRFVWDTDCYANLK